MSSVVWVGLGLSRGGSVPGIRPFGVQVIEFAVSGIFIEGVALLIATRRPENRTWIPLALMTAGGTQGAIGEYAILAVLRQPHTYPGGAAAVWVSSWLFVIFLASFATILQVFPTGRPIPGRWWGRALWAAPAGALLLAVSMALTPGFSQNYPAGSPGPIHNPLAVAGVDSLLRIMDGVASVGLLASTLVGVAALVTRFRRGTADERQQLKPFLFVASFAIFSFNRSFFSEGSPIWWTGVIATNVVLPLGLPLAIGVAILRYRLYDLDIVIRRTFIYGALAAFITASYVGVVTGIGTLVGSGGRANVLLSILATAIIAVAFQPVRGRLQRVANRIAYGRRATPYEVLAEISSRAGESYAADEVLPRMARALAEGTGAARAAVWVRTGEVMHEAAAWPDSTRQEPVHLPGGQLLPRLDGAAQMVPVRHQGELLGAVRVDKRVGEALTPVENRLLEDLAAQAGLVLKNFGLTAELRARLEELRASRSRLVAAQDGERRRIERNLHDGAQQNLVALKVKVGLVERLVDSDPVRVKSMLADFKVEVGDALENLRDLAHGIYPPLLADRGLVAALESQARKATVPVEIASVAVDRYPAEVEAAVYFCVLEALQNVQKYAEARAVVVRISGSGDVLAFEVEDDGNGFDPGTRPRGSGLTNMADRLEALEGSVVVRSAPGQGTTVSGSVPVG